VPYRLATERRNYSDLASGFVLRSAPRHPAFPVWLAAELFLRAAAYLPERPQLSLWDPCCGSGYLVSVLGFLYRPRLARVICSDISAEEIAIAARNLALLTEARLAERERELRQLAAMYGKPGYTEAASAARRLAGELRAAGGDLPSAVAAVDVFGPVGLAQLPTADLVITDVPYGEQTSWQGSAPPGDDVLSALLQSLCQVLPGHAVVALCARARRVSFGRPVPALELVRLGQRAAFLGRVADIKANW
jgi:23S rRNA G2445 N2-methylase RlmL